MKTTSVPKAKQPQPQPPLVIDKKRFDSNLAAAIGGLCAQFEQRDDDSFTLYTEGQDEFDRSEVIGRRAIQIAAVIEKLLMGVDFEAEGELVHFVDGINTSEQPMKA
jgi:hypothetical protein